MKKQKKPGILHMLWKQRRPFMIIAPLMIVLFGTVSLVATLNPFLANTISTVLGGERRVLQSGDPNSVQYYDKTASFKQFDPGIEDFERNAQGQELSSGEQKKQAQMAAGMLNQEICEEGFVLLKNESQALPLTEGAMHVSVFGKNSANLVLGGSGSGGGSAETSVSLYEGMKNAGITLNPKLMEFYESSASGSGREANPAIGSSTTGLTIGETPYDKYPNDVIDSYKDYQDAAIVVISRIGGEGFDLPRTMVTEYGGAPVSGAKEGQHYLELDENEERLLDEVCHAGFDKVIVLINSAEPMELGFLNDRAEIDAALWIGFPGGTGASAVGKVLTGAVNPSGRLVDTYVRDFTQDPTWQNFGDNRQVKGNMYLQGGAESGYYYVQYEEGIFLGYRYYETRSFQEIYRFGDDGGVYDSNVVYPFGYGLSYTDFQWELVESETTATGLIEDPEQEISITVKVTNTGKFAGKDVVQLYYSAPYYNGGIEKAHVVLGDYAKTALLQPGESGCVTLKLKASDMVSYDHVDANGNGFKGYELEQGIYRLYIGQNAHQAWNQDEEHMLSRSFYVPETIMYAMDIDGASTASDNQFDEMTDYMQKYASVMSRFSFDSTYPSAPTQADREIDSDLFNALTFVYNDQDAPYYTPDASLNPIPTTLQLYDMIGVSFDDPKWEELVNSISEEDLINLIGTGNFNTARIDSIGKPRTIDPDGPAGFTNFMGDPSVHDTGFYASECVIGATWNKDLAYDMGVMIGIEGQIGYTNGDERPYSGWYAPAVNIHRSPFSGRNWEYYSEDPYLTGAMGLHVVQGANSKGVYTYVKHFVLNDQETNRDTGGLITWADEQTLREIYMKPFQMIVQQGGTHALMSSFNRIGTTWAGGSYALLTNVLRKEWGFQGMIVSDYNLGNAYMPPNQMIRAGGDINLSQAYLPTASANVKNGMDAATQIAMMRRAAKNILYTVANSCAMNGLGTGVTYAYLAPLWMVWTVIANVLLIVSMALWGYFCVRKVQKGKKQMSVS